MMTTRQAVGIAAAQSVRMEVSPRNLGVGKVQERLEKQGGHLTSEVVKAYLSQKLPSGITLEEHMERVRLDEIERWKKLGEL